MQRWCATEAAWQWWATFLHIHTNISASLAVWHRHQGRQSPMYAGNMCQDPARQAMATSDRAGLGRLWIGLGFRFPRSAHLLSSLTFHAVHTTRVPSRKMSFHCVHTFGHNLAFCMIISVWPYVLFQNLAFVLFWRPTLFHCSWDTPFCVPIIFVPF